MLRASDCFIVQGARLVVADTDPPVPTSFQIRAGRFYPLAEENLRDVPVLHLPGWIVVPGFIDMHTHVTRYPEYCSDLLRWGVTGIREAGSPYSYITAFRQRRVRPQLSSAGPLIDGDPPRWPHLSRQLVTAEEVPAVVQEHLEHGLQWVKVYYRLDPELTQDLVRAAKSAGLQVMGHLGDRVSWRRALEMGFDTLEHVRLGIGDGLLPRRLAEKVARTPWPWKDILFWNLLNLQHRRLHRIWEEMARRQMVWTPTLATLAVALVNHAPGEDRMPRWHQERWRNKSYRLTPADPHRRLARRAFTKVLASVRMAHEAGVRIAVGTDTPNVHTAPGWSFHWELALLARAGIPVGELLNMATYQSYQVLKWPRPFTEGEPVSFVVLATRQIKTVQDLRKIVAVFHHGAWAFFHPRLAMRLLETPGRVP